MAARVSRAVRTGTWRDPTSGQITFGECANRWHQAQDLAVSTMQTYRNHNHGHLLPAFEDKAIADILATDITAWEKRELALGYEPTSVRGWRAVLHVILRGRGRRRRPGLQPSQQTTGPGGRRRPGQPPGPGEDRDESARDPHGRGAGLPALGPR
jgi:hypothetical protein